MKAQTKQEHRFKAYLVDLDKDGAGIKGFRRFRSLKTALPYARKNAGSLYCEYQNGDMVDLEYSKGRT